MNPKNLLRSLALVCALTLLWNSIGDAAPTTFPSPKFNVVAFYNGTFDLAHINFVQEAIVWFPKMGHKYGFTFTATNNWELLNKDFLSNFQVVMFLDDHPHVYSQKAAFQHYMETGGAWMGFHACAYNEIPREWSWYFNTFLGCGAFRNNTWFPTKAVLKVDDPNHPAMTGLGDTFTSAISEWYSWKTDMTKNPDIDVLASVDPSCFPLGTDPNQSWYNGYYPILWTNRKFKMVYANFGHNAMNYKANIGKSSTFASDDQNKFIINSILWLGSR
jgi:uncharacterized protein